MTVRFLKKDYFMTFCSTLLATLIGVLVAVLVSDVHKEHKEKNIAIKTVRISQILTETFTNSLLLLQQNHPSNKDIKSDAVKFFKIQL